MVIKKNALNCYMGYILLAMMFMINHPTSANAHPKNTSEDAASSSARKWHPKMFYIVMHDSSLRFILPYEPDQSGFYNLFFISKASGETRWFDTVKNNQRYFTPFSSGDRYDAVLLYNNGKYVRCNDIVFENGIEVDMSNQRIQPSDSLSERWKTMRSFGDTINGRASDRDDTAVSDFIIKGYVFSRSIDGVDYTWQIKGDTTWAPVVQSNGSIVKRKKCTYDGYFEIDVEDDSEQMLGFSAHFHALEEINMTAPCGLFLVMKGLGKARRVPK
jgi:hypothetical protein